MNAVRQKKELGWASPGLPDPRTLARTWGTHTEWRQPLQQVPFIASLTCPGKSLARDDKFVATLISNR
jgi:hypothetical protein